MLYQKSIDALVRWLVAAVVGILSAPFFLLAGMDKLARRVAGASWWRAYWGRVTYHEAEGQRYWYASRGKALGHWAAFLALAAPVWVPVVALAMFLLGKVDR